VIVVDTSIWADHFHRPIDHLLECIGNGLVSHHPFVTGELVLGNLTDRLKMVEMLDSLPQAPVVEHGQLIRFVEAQRMGGTGVGFVDAHLLASAASRQLRLWSRDKRLTVQADRLNLAYTP
jgi:predicted nucleic acid-binding protein